MSRIGNLLTDTCACIEEKFLEMNSPRCYCAPDCGALVFGEHIQLIAIQSHIGTDNIAFILHELVNAKAPIRKHRPNEWRRVIQHSLHLIASISRSCAHHVIRAFREHRQTHLMHRKRPFHAGHLIDRAGITLDVTFSNEPCWRTICNELIHTG